MSGHQRKHHSRHHTGPTESHAPGHRLRGRRSGTGTAPGQVTHTAAAAAAAAATGFLQLSAAESLLRKRHGTGAYYGNCRQHCPGWEPLAVMAQLCGNGQDAMSQSHSHTEIMVDAYGPT